MDLEISLVKTYDNSINVTDICENLLGVKTVNILWTDCEKKQFVCAYRGRILIVDNGRVYETKLPNDMEGYHIDKLIFASSHIYLLCLKYESGQYYKKAVRISDDVMKDKTSNHLLFKSTMTKL